MSHKSRIDTPGALHHIIARGIDRKNIFKDDKDRDNFLERLGAIIEETQTHCFAWALIPNHFHLLMKTGATPISTVMRRLTTLTVYIWPVLLEITSTHTAPCVLE